MGSRLPAPGRRDRRSRSVLGVAAAAQPPPPELTATGQRLRWCHQRRRRAALDTIVEQLRAASGDRIVVATVRTFKPYPDLQTYAVQMFENHGKGIGGKGKDNGLLILVAVDDRQVWIEVGYGLEGFITDGFAGETSRETMVPFFRRGDYGEGLVAGATRVAQRIAEGRNVTLRGRPRHREPAARPVGNIRLNPITAGLIVLYILYRLLRGGGPEGAAGGGRSGVVDWSRAGRPAGGGWQSDGVALPAVWRRLRGRSLWWRRRRRLVVERKPMRKLIRWCAVIVWLLRRVVTGTSTGCSYNTFVSQDEGIKTQWAQVENQLQRRNDLIPNLVETTKGFAQQERDVFGNIAESRAKLAGAQTPEQRMAAANEQSSALARLLVVVENYPDLKSNETFARLMDELAGTENRISVERMRYNEAVQAYNTAAPVVPRQHHRRRSSASRSTSCSRCPSRPRYVPKVDFNAERSNAERATQFGPHFLRFPTHSPLLPPSKLMPVDDVVLAAKEIQPLSSGCTDAHVGTGARPRTPYGRTRGRRRADAGRLRPGLAEAGHRSGASRRLAPGCTGWQ